MPHINPVGIALLAAGLGLAVVLGLLARRWAIGRSAHVTWWSGLLELPHGYLHTVHAVVHREREAARMHALVAGGFLAALILSLPLHLGYWPRLLAVGILVSVLVSVAGIAMAIRRRSGGHVPRLKPSRNVILPYLLLGLLIVLAAGAVLQLLGAGTAAFGILAVPAGALFLFLLQSAYGGALRHAVAGAVHLVVHPRPCRVRGEPDAALLPLDLDTEPLGVGTMKDFAWNRLVGFDACVQCGRCEAVCPAYAAGQPLNPKALIGSLSLAVSEPDRPAAEVVTPEALWACTTCRACVYECPMLIEHVDAIVSIRRHAVMEQGVLPSHAADTLASLRETDTQSGRALDTRLDWAVDLALPILAEGGACDTLLWLGEHAFDMRHQRTLRSLVTLLRRAGVDFAVLGAAELDCGDIARRLGDEVTFAGLAQRNVAILALRKFRRIVTADPHAFNILKNEYPAFGGHYEILHHTQMLAELIGSGRLSPDTALDERVTYHDPCYLGRYNGETQASRNVLAALGVELVEMERSGMRSSCCGGGGGAPLAAIQGRRQIAENRMDHARATGAPTLIAGCPQCMQMFEGVPGDRLSVMDLAEFVDRATGGAP